MGEERGAELGDFASRPRRIQETKREHGMGLPQPAPCRKGVLQPGRTELPRLARGGEDGKPCHVPDVSSLRAKRSNPARTARRPGLLRRSAPRNDERLGTWMAPCVAGVVISA